MCDLCDEPRSEFDPAFEGESELTCCSNAGVEGAYRSGSCKFIR